MRLCGEIDFANEDVEFTRRRTKFRRNLRLPEVEEYVVALASNTGVHG